MILVPARTYDSQLAMQLAPPMRYAIEKGCLDAKFLRNLAVQQIPAGLNTDDQGFLFSGQFVGNGPLALRAAILPNSLMEGLKHF